MPFIPCVPFVLSIYAGFRVTDFKRVYGRVIIHEYNAVKDLIIHVKGFDTCIRIYGEIKYFGKYLVYQSVGSDNGFLNSVSVARTLIEIQRCLVLVRDIIVGFVWVTLFPG